MTGDRGLQLSFHLQEMHRSGDYSVKVLTKVGDSGAFSIQTQDLCSDFHMLSNVAAIFNYLSAEDKLNKVNCPDRPIWGNDSQSQV